MSPTAFVQAVRELKARHGATHAALAELVPLLRNFVGDRANQDVPWPAASRGEYTRMLLNDLGDDFQIVVVAWPRGKSSPVHDHAGTVGAVAALAGVTSENKYCISDAVGDSVQLELAGTTRLCGRMVALLAPEDGLELHDMAHASGEPAATVHVYLTPVESFNVYEPLPDGRHRRERRRLWMDVVRGASLWPAPRQAKPALAPVLA